MPSDELAPELALQAANILATEPSHGPRHDAAVEIAVAVLRMVANSPARWGYDGLAKVLLASDPGMPAPLSFTPVTDFTFFFVGDLLRLPRIPIDVSSLGSIKNVGRMRYDLANRLRDRRLYILAAAVDEIRLEQDDRRVLAIYDPDGVPLRLEDYS